MRFDTTEVGGFEWCLPQIMEQQCKEGVSVVSIDIKSRNIEPNSERTARETTGNPNGPREIQTDRALFFWNFGVRAHSGIRNFGLSRAFQPIPSYAFKVQVVLDTLQRGKFDQTIFWLSTRWSSAAIIWSVNGPKQAFWSADDPKH
jgi:hypothetical protein